MKLTMYAPDANLCKIFRKNLRETNGAISLIVSPRLFSGNISNFDAITSRDTRKLLMRVLYNHFYNLGDTIHLMRNWGQARRT